MNEREDIARCLYCEEPIIRKVYGRNRLYCDSQCFYLSKNTNQIGTYFNMWLINNQLLISNVAKESRGMGTSRLYHYANKGIPYRKNKLDGGIIAAMVYATMCKFQKKPNIDASPVDYRFLLAAPAIPLGELEKVRQYSRIPLLTIINSLFGKRFTKVIKDGKGDTETEKGRVCTMIESKSLSVLKSLDVSVPYKESSFVVYLKELKRKKGLYLRSDIAHACAELIKIEADLSYDYRELMSPLNKEEILRLVKKFDTFSLKNNTVKPVFKKPQQKYGK